MKWFGKFNIGKRLAAGFALVLTLMLLITVFSIWRMNDIADASLAMSTPLAKERLISEWNTQVFGAVRRTGAIVKSADPGVAAYFKQDADTALQRSSELSKQIEPLLTTPEEVQLLRKIDAQRKLYREATSSAMKAKAQGNQELANSILDASFTPAGKGFQDLLNELLVLQHKQMDAHAQSIQDIQIHSVKLLVGLAIVALLIGVCASWLLSAGIVGPLRTAVGVAETVASGDLSLTIDSQGSDETAALMRALRHMNDSLVGIVGEVRGGTDTIAVASREISAGSLDLSGRTEQQASALEETAASMEELTTTVRQNADNARQANQLAITASEVATRGGVVVGEVITTMSAINESAKEIVDIISVIDGIAFQTNILALNAAVEAARAGEQGRGFAVVASEVRTLAQRSAAAAKEIKALIGNSVDKVNTGAKLVDQAGATMEQVVVSIGRVTGIVAEIAHASQEQTTGIEQVNQAIGQMDEVTQQNAALVEESAAAAASMQEQAVALATLVDVFKLGQAYRQPGTASVTAASRPASAGHGRAVPAPVARLRNHRKYLE
ncbi:methyl-accepting chemotaxis protein [Undibacterium sp.]|uniref:methyl-accepting chemotaxis protein n=1 Tax=Undibacterium sp. TaxID=1914977 RepID=UPI00374D735A